MTVRSQTDRSDYAPGFPRGSRDADEREAMGREANPPSRRPVCCPVLSERRWLCSRHEDHGGDHIASDGEDILDRWPRIPPPQPEATPPQRDGDDRSAALAKSSASSPAPAAEVDLTEALRDEIEKYLRWMEPEWYATVPQLRGAIRKVLAERDADLREMAQWALPLCYCQGEAVCPAHRALAKKEPTP
jgi:hypothetical protein